MPGKCCILCSDTVLSGFSSPFGAQWWSDPCFHHVFSTRVSRVGFNFYPVGGFAGIRAGRRACRRRSRGRGGALTVPGVALTERFAQGGFTMYALLALSFVMVTYGVERLVNLRRKTICPHGLAETLDAAWKTGDMGKVIAAADAQPSVLGSVVTVLANHRHVSGADASVMAGDEVSRLMRRHLQKSYPLAIVATLSPLLGLLGTVTGMIDAFEVVAIAGSLGDASMLAGGIAKALITTAFGLLVAIPALGLYHHYRGKTHELALEVEEELNELLRAWFLTDPKASGIKEL